MFSPLEGNLVLFVGYHEAVIEQHTLLVFVINEQFGNVSLCVGSLLNPLHDEDKGTLY